MAHVGLVGRIDGQVNRLRLQDMFGDMPGKRLSGPTIDGQASVLAGRLVLMGVLLTAGHPGELSHQLACHDQLKLVGQPVSRQRPRRDDTVPLGRRFQAQEDIDVHRDP
jgi:hypothetical protein